MVSKQPSHDAYENQLDDLEKMRQDIRQTAEYRRLKHLFLFGDLLGSKETPMWQIWTPTRSALLCCAFLPVQKTDSESLRRYIERDQPNDQIRG